MCDAGADASRNYEYAAWWLKVHQKAAEEAKQEEAERIEREARAKQTQLSMNSRPDAGKFECSM